MDILEKAEKIMAHGYVCDDCLGRQFAKLLTATDNRERGKIVRTFFAMQSDAKGDLFGADPSNLYGFMFHNEKLSSVSTGKPGKCSVCKGFFSKIGKLAEKAAKELKKYGFDSFSVGTVLSSDLLEREERLWEEAGLDYCEPLKSAINREIGKRIEKALGKKANLKNPDINLIIDLSKNSVRVIVNPLFIYGEYQKLVRGLPQTKWPSGKYRDSVEQIIARKLVRKFGTRLHKFHGLGREDIDARCLAWRPFVIEFTSPVKREFNDKEAEKIINKGGKVRVRNLRKSSMEQVRRIKDSRAIKEYRVQVICSKDLEKRDLAKLKQLVGSISQRTPSRVMHRRADLVRKRSVYDVKSRHVGKRRFILLVRAEAGLYVKELVSGDKGRTSPSVSAILGCDCAPKDLDVMKICA